VVTKVEVREIVTKLLL